MGVKDEKCIQPTGTFVLLGKKKIDISFTASQEVDVPRMSNRLDLQLGSVKRSMDTKNKRQGIRTLRYSCIFTAVRCTRGDEPTA